MANGEIIETTAISIPTGPLRDMRAGFMLMPVETMRAGLAEYSERRKAFRDWLRSHLVEGIHFGFPPGLTPRTDGEGNFLVWNSRKNRDDVVNPKQWTPKPSLYKAGANFVCDLMGARDEYKADLMAWRQLGKPDGTFVFACHLYSRATGELLGEGRGIRKVGDKGGDANNAIKMAKKCAHVDAVLSAWALTDLFTQDLEEGALGQPEQHGNPTPDETKPKVHARSERATVEQLKGLVDRWKAIRSGNGKSPDDELAWARFAQAAGVADPNKSRSLSSWNVKKIDFAHGMLDEESGMGRAPEPTPQSGEPGCPSKSKTMF
jgi:hypothetical protein